MFITSFLLWPCLRRLLPFSGKAFNVDDPLFVYVARQITHHPLDPYGFKVNWFLDAVPMAHETKNILRLRLITSQLLPASSDGRNGHYISPSSCLLWRLYGVHTVWHNGLLIRRCWRQRPRYLRLCFWFLPTA